MQKGDEHSSSSLSGVMNGNLVEKLVDLRIDSSADLLSNVTPGIPASDEQVLVRSDSIDHLDLENSFESNDQQFYKLPTGSISEIADKIQEIKQSSESSTPEPAKSFADTNASKEQMSPSLEIKADEAFTVGHQNTSPNVPRHQSVVSENEGGASDLESSTSSCKYKEDFVSSQGWRNKDKHVFILSTAGKPIYSRHGNEEKLSTIMGVMQAMVSFVQDNNDKLKHIVTQTHRFVFLTLQHLILVVVSKEDESVSFLNLQLTYLYNQIISILTLTQLNSIFHRHTNFDLRRLLGGSEKSLDGIVNLMEREPGMLLSSIKCLPLSSTVRDTIAQTIAQHAKLKNIVFAMLLCRNQLISLVKIKNYFLHPFDLHLIFNLLASNESLKFNENWIPICLPKFDSSGYLHAHLSYIDPPELELCLIMLSVDKESFFNLSECRQKIIQRFHKYDVFHHLRQTLQNEGGSMRTSQIHGVEEIRHFLYKSRRIAQYTSPVYEQPYLDSSQRRRIMAIYKRLHNRVHSITKPLKLIFSQDQHEASLGWLTVNFELYAIFSPLVQKSLAIQSINRLLKYIEREEHRLFILSSPVF